MTGDNEASYVLPEQLCIGLYVYIDLPWFSHPFSFNHFKIRNEQQLLALRELSLKRFRYDPERSDAAPLSLHTEQTPPAPTPAPTDDPQQIAKQERIEKLAKKRERITQMERSFLKATAVMRNLNKNLLARPKEGLAEVADLVDQIALSFLDAPEATLHVMGEKAGAEDVYYHGLNCCILSLMLAKELNVSPEDCRLLGLSALLHDIGLMDIPDKVLKKSFEEMTTHERELRKLHCEYGVRIAQKIGVPDKAQTIIAQHHEFADGSGYPNGLRGDEIHLLSRIVIPVNHYDNLCNPADISKAMTPHEALSLMFASRRSKFDSQVLQLMIRSLGVYPPGTIVKLSNESIALVSSVNPRKPLRPWVLLYDESIPKEEAQILDMEQEPDINISKAIRPIQLPRHVYDYLSPRRRVTYYFDEGSPQTPPKP